MLMSSDRKVADVIATSCVECQIDNLTHSTEKNSIPETEIPKNLILLGFNLASMAF